jgi:hypothetical protein
MCDLVHEQNTQVFGSGMRLCSELPVAYGQLQSVGVSAEAVGGSEQLKRFYETAGALARKAIVSLNLGN